MFGEQRAVRRRNDTDLGRAQARGCAASPRVRRGHGADQKPGVEILEGRDTRSARGQEHRENSPLGNDFRGFDVGFDHNRIAGRPRGPGQHQMRDPQVDLHTTAAWAVMVAANGWVASTTASTLRSDQPAPHPVGPAEAADAYFADRQGGVGHPACQRADHLDAGMQPSGQRARLGGAAQQEHRVNQCLPAPRVRAPAYDSPNRGSCRRSPRRPTRLPRR